MRSANTDSFEFPDPPHAHDELNKLGFTKQALEKYENGVCHADALAAGTVETPAELQQHLEQMLKIAAEVDAGKWVSELPLIRPGQGRPR